MPRPAPPGDEPTDPGPAPSAAEELVDYAELRVSDLAELAEDAEPPETRRRRRWILPVRILVSLAMLAVLARRIPEFSWSEVVPEWRTSTPIWIAVAVALTLASIALSAVRWQQVLGALGHRVPLRTLTNQYFAGQFVSNVLPTTIGGDVVRVSRLAGVIDDPADSFASVTIERLTGWLVLPVISVVGLAVDPSLRQLGWATTVVVLVSSITLVGLVLILVAADHPRLGGRLAHGEGWRRFLGAVHLGVGRLRRHPAAAGRVVAAGFAYQLCLVAAAVAAGGVIGLDVGVAPYVAFIPVVLMIQVLPIGISGLGPREWALVVLFTPLGVPQEKAVALGLLLYLLNVTASLAGAPSFALGSRSGRPAAP